MRFDFIKAGRFHYNPPLKDLLELGFSICQKNDSSDNKNKVVAILDVPNGYFFFTPDKTGYKFEYEEKGHYGNPKYLKIFYPYNFNELKKIIDAKLGK